nr:hypothetical protein [Desulfobacterales bacterium]
MPPVAVSLQDLAESLCRPKEELFPLLESMADKGLVATRKKHGVCLYKLLPVTPGMFEFKFMRGGDTDRDRRLARLLSSYANIAKKEAKELLPIPEHMTPLMRAFL